MSILITNIKKLVQVETKPVRFKAGKQMSELNSIENAFLQIHNGKIASFGEMKNLKPETWNLKQTIDATGKMVFPCFCDSHTHLVYPASREIEYVDKIKGLSYEEIAKRGGGILNTAKK
jgi:imidazolonepropionase